MTGLDLRALIQRVSSASVRVDEKTVGEIETGLLLFVGFAREDNKNQVDATLDKVLGSRIFPDTGADGKVRMSNSLSDIGGGLLIVPQFTLVADTAKGLRPGFSTAASPADAISLYEYFVQEARARHTRVETGLFGADMQVALVNDGPVTFLLEYPAASR